MKNLKRAFSLVLAITIVLAMSVSAFAFSLNSGYYTYELRFENSAGEKITSAEEGSEVYLAFYLYETANPTAGTNVTVNNNGMFLYDVIIPKGFMSDETAYTGSEGAEYDASNGTTIIIDAEEFFVLLNDLGTGLTVTPSSTTPIAKHKFVLGDANATPYEFTFAGNSLVFADGSNGEAKDAVQVPASLTITAAAPQEDKTVTTQTATNGATQIKYGADVADADKVLAGKYVVMNSVEAPAGLTATSRVVVKYVDAENPSLNKEVEYGKTIFEYLGITGEGKTTTKGIKFGVVYEDANYKAANFTFTIK